MNRFKLENELEKRVNESGKIRKKYPERVAVIVQRSEGCKNVDEIDKKKYLVPGDLTVGQFVYVIRKRLKITPEKAIFMFVGDRLPPTGKYMSDLFADEKDEDGFLYIFYASENTFG